MELKSWLAKVDDGTLLRKLTLIGTNDSFSYLKSNIFTKHFYRTQNKTLEEQLDMGVRYLDVTLYSDFSTCYIKCGCKGVKIDDILVKCNKFLSDNPSEFLIINIRAGYTTSKKFLTLYNEMCDECGTYMMNTDNNITVGELRGKIIFFNVINSNEYIENIRTRVSYSPNYPLRVEGCLLKYSEIVSFDLESQEQDERMYINYTHSRGYVLGFIPLPILASKCVNKMIYDAYSNTLMMKDTILVVDFVSKDMVKCILKNNFNHL